MTFFKLGLLTCGFYVALTLLLEAALWAMAYNWGLGMVLSGERFGFASRFKLGMVFFVLWLVSFAAACYFARAAKVQG